MTNSEIAAHLSGARNDTPSFSRREGIPSFAIQILGNIKARNANDTPLLSLPGTDSAEAIWVRPIEIATHLSGARNYTSGSRREGIPSFAIQILGNIKARNANDTPLLSLRG